MTAIPYLDEMWPIVTGCTKCSPGCLNCYAARWAATRLKHQPHYAGLAHKTADGYDWCGTPRFHPELLDKPLRWRKSRRIGVCFTADLFHEAITDEQINEVILHTIQAYRHTYVILTKRPERMRRLFIERRDELNHIPGNLMLGVTVCNQQEADEKIPILLATPAAKRWVSIEPMLGPVKLSRWLYCPSCHAEGATAGADCLRAHSESCGLATLDLVVLGGETGPGARPMQPQWALDVFNQCKSAGVPFWFKELGDAFRGGDFRADVLAQVVEMAGTHELPEAKT